MVVYEVNISIHPSIEKEYAQLVERHRVTLLSQPGFRGFSWFRREMAAEGAPTDSFAPTDWIHWVVQYQVTNRESLEAYLEGPGKELRGEGPRLFGDKVKAFRRILHSV